MEYSMRTARLLANLTIVAGLTAFTPLRPAHPLVGKWNIEYERGRQNMNGEVTIITGKATLDIAEQGDSLIATLTPVATNDGRPTPPPSRMAGTGSGSSATFKWTSQSRVNVNDEERTVTITSTWELKAEGDTLTGTSTRAMADMPGMNSPAAVKGTRVK
jgi:hypothetical protein